MFISTMNDFRSTLNKQLGVEPVGLTIDAALCVQAGAIAVAVYVHNEVVLSIGRANKIATVDGFQLLLKVSNLRVGGSLCSIGTYSTADPCETSNETHNESTQRNPETFVHNNLLVTEFQSGGFPAG